MNASTSNSATLSVRTHRTLLKSGINNGFWLLLGLIVILLLSSESAYSQNTKGDKPSGTNRENRFRIPSKKSGKKSKTGTVKRVKPKGPSVASSGREYSPRTRAKGGERAGRPIKPTFSKSKPSKDQKPWKGDITGRRLRTKGTESTGRYVHPQQGRYVRKNVPDREIGRSRTAGTNRVTVRSRSGKTKNVFPQKNRFVNNPSTKPRDTQRPVSNRPQIARLNRIQSTPQGTPPGKKKIIPRSASRSYIARKSINVYANFPRPKRKPEKAYTKDIAGRPLRAKNYETPKPGVIKPSFQPYYGRKRIGDKPYKGPAAGKYRSATKPGERAWTGDVAGRQIRHRDRSSKRSVEGTPILSKRIKSASQSGEKRTGLTPLIGKAPPRAAIGVATFRGNIKGKRTPKGGGSISGKFWNNKGIPVATRTPKSKDAAKAAGYSGNKRFGRPAYRDQGEEFSGNIKFKKPLKGGGSVSGKLWNNNERPLIGKAPREGTKAALFQGNIKAKRQEKGGGSISGKLWNNNERAIATRTPKSKDAAKVAGYPGKLKRFSTQPGFRDQGEEFAGNIKIKKPAKGGRVDLAVPVKTPPARAKKEAGYPGNLKRFQVQPGFADQGEEFTGHIKLSRFRKNYVQNKKADEESIKKRRPEKTVYAVEGLQVKAKRRDYVRNKNASEEALLKLKPTKATQQVAGLQVRVKQYNYKHNPSSADDALKVREPGKAFARATDYQGNIKMQKFALFERNRQLHPDAKFVKTNKNNVAQEKDMLTNLKLWWARLFRKEETQPSHLKDKGRKPRYDKGEKGLWYE